jgi:phosphotransferase system HPr-like phosphotransfer protein
MTEGRRINAKSLLGLLSANIKAGDIVQVICYNDNYHIAIDDLDDIITIVTRLAVMDDED